MGHDTVELDLSMAPLAWHTRVPGLGCVTALYEDASMLYVRRCGGCGAEVRRSECRVEPDGLFGPELICPCCEGVVNSRVTVLGWILVVVSAVSFVAGAVSCQMRGG